MKKFASIFLTLAMIFTLSVPAFAAGTGTYELKITGATGHVYDIFQIYTGTIFDDDKDTPDTADDTTVLSDVRFGKNHVSMNVLTGTFFSVGDLVPSLELKDFMASADPVEYVSGMITDAAPFVNDAKPDIDVDANTVIVNLDPGYYMIVDVTAPEDMPDGQTQSRIILQMVGDVTVASKHASVTSEKKVKDKNDSDNTESVWQDSADYDIGDHVPFQLSVTLPSTLDVYDTYELTFHDKQADGFAPPQITRVYIFRKGDPNTPADDVVIDIPKKIADSVPNGYTHTPGCIKSNTCEYGGCTFTITVGDVKQLYTGNESFVNGDQIIVEYTSQLTANANIGRVGNENNMYVCHPDGHTPKDIVTVLTYGLNINKVDENGSPLSGAIFTLQKKVNGGFENVVGKAYTVNGDTETEVVDNATYKTATRFRWTGLDDGVYKLVEVEAPEGYNALAEQTFTIYAQHTENEWHGQSSALEKVLGREGDSNPTANAVFSDADVNFVQDGVLEGDIINYQGAKLPETGAQGTIMFIALGTVLVLVAGVFMITRKKMSIYED